MKKSRLGMPGWIQVEHALAEERARTLPQVNTMEAVRSFRTAWAHAHRHAAASLTSGLIEQQRLFAKLSHRSADG